MLAIQCWVSEGGVTTVSEELSQEKLKVVDAFNEPTGAISEARVEGIV